MCACVCVCACVYVCVCDLGHVRAHRKALTSLQYTKVVVLQEAELPTTKISNGGKSGKRFTAHACDQARDQAQQSIKKKKKKKKKKVCLCVCLSVCVRVCVKVRRRSAGRPQLQQLEAANTGAHAYVRSVCAFFGACCCCANHATQQMMLAMHTRSVGACSSAARASTCSTASSSRSAMIDIA